MIYVTRPVTETHKTVPSTAERTLDSSFRERVPVPVDDGSTPRESRDFNFDQEELSAAIAEVNDMIFKDNSRFEFKLHERTGRIMVKLIDKDTKEVLKEIPPEKILDLVASIWDLVGILVDERG